MKLKLNNDCNHGNSRRRKKEKKPGLGKRNNWTINYIDVETALRCCHGVGL